MADFSESTNYMAIFFRNWLFRQNLVGEFAFNGFGRDVEISDDGGFEESDSDHGGTGVAEAF